MLAFVVLDLVFQY